MGQFTEQIQQINAAQSEILTERKRKQQQKEQKEFLQYLINKYKLELIEIIEPLRDESFENIFYNDNISIIINNFEKELQKYSYFDKITIQLKVKELEDFIYKEILKQKTRYKKIELEEAKKQKEFEKQRALFWKKDLYLLMEKKYKEYKNPFQVFERLQI